MHVSLDKCCPHDSASSCMRLFVTSLCAWSSRILSALKNYWIQFDCRPSSSQQVFKCGESGCGHFYHLRCLAEVVSAQEGHSGVDAIAIEEAEYKKLGFFRCPLHFCLGCGQLEKMGVENWLVKCRRCPKAYHVECLPL